MKRTDNSLRDLWDNIKCTNIQIIRIPEESEKKKQYENFFQKIILENFPNMEKEIVNQVQEVQSPIQDKPKGKHIKHTIIKLKKSKHKERILKAARDGKNHYNIVK